MSGIHHRLHFIQKSIQKKFPALLFSWFLILFTPLFFWLHNRVYTGPAYLADEVGYLINAAFLGGYVVDGASSYHLGYAIFIAPVFGLFDTPTAVWQGVMVVNALLWGCSFFLLWQLVKISDPKLSPTHQFIILLISILYPAWLTMSGYAFATSAFVVVFIASMITLARWQQAETRSLIPHTLWVSYLYWIHPTALGVILASFITVLLAARRAKTYRALVIHITLVFILVVFYKKVVHHALGLFMTPQGYLPLEHYPSITGLFLKMGDFSFWIDLLAKIFGQWSYIFIGTFGLAFYAIMMFINQILAIKFDGCAVDNTMDNAVDNNARLAIAVYLPLSLLFVMGIGAALFSSADSPRTIDEWIYGRYIDHLSMPLLAFGIVALIHFSKERRLAAAVMSSIVLICTALLIQSLVVAGVANNLVNTPAFWPQYLYISPDFIKWTLVGLGGIGLVALGGKYMALVLMSVSLFYSSSAQDQWHQGILSGYSKPGSLVAIVHQNYSPGSCIAFDPHFPEDASLSQHERFNLYKFYFFNYRYQRMTPSAWLDHCDGPLLTYNASSLAKKGAQFRVVARERSSGLFLVSRRDQTELTIPPAVANAPDISYINRENEYCFLAQWCLTISGSELMRFTVVGQLDDQTLISSQQAGYLFYGPYQPIRQGSYMLMIRGHFKIEDCVVIDIASQSGSVQHAETTLCRQHCDQTIVMPFELAADAEAIEVRLKVTASDFIAVSGYQIISAEGYRLSNPVTGSAGFCADATFNPVH